MAVDTFAKRMTVAGVPFLPLGVNVFPGTTSSTLGRAAGAWNYAPDAPTPPIGGVGGQTQVGVGSKRSFSQEPILGGGGGW